MTLVNVEKLEQLKELVDTWAMTWEGLREDYFEEAMELACINGNDGIGYLIKGSAMNDICHLTGNNAYPSDLNIFAIKDFKGLAFQFGARWMWDVVKNNGRRQRYLPFEM